MQLGERTGYGECERRRFGRRTNERGNVHALRRETRVRTRDSCQRRDYQHLANKEIVDPSRS